MRHFVLGEFAVGDGAELSALFELAAFRLLGWNGEDLLAGGVTADEWPEWMRGFKDY